MAVLDNPFFLLLIFSPEKLYESVQQKFAKLIKLRRSMVLITLK